MSVWIENMSVNMSEVTSVEISALYLLAAVRLDVSVCYLGLSPHLQTLADTFRHLQTPADTFRHLQTATSQYCH